LQRAGAGNGSQQVAHRIVSGVAYLRAGRGQGGAQYPQQAAALGLQLGVADAPGLNECGFSQIAQPLGKDVLLMIADELRGRAYVIGHA
jgi:hypothetical protein